MNTALVLVICFVVASGYDDWEHNWDQQPGRDGKKDKVLDYVHSYRFEEHSKGDMRLLIAINDAPNDKSCHLIDIDGELACYLQNQEDIEQVTNEIYGLIKEQQQNETAISQRELEDIDDRHLTKECDKHKTFKMVYKPSFNATAQAEP